MDTNNIVYAPRRLIAVMTGWGAGDVSDRQFGEQYGEADTWVKLAMKKALRVRAHNRAFNGMMGRQS